MNIENRENKIEILRSYLKYPGESPFVDYKAAILFQEGSEFSHKLVKHTLGMANAGGGYVIIGFKEDASRIPQPDPRLTEEIIASYEVTRFSQFVNKFIEGEEKIDLLIFQVDYEGKQYPIIEVREFKESPFFCKSSTNDGILKEGSLYFRDLASRTVRIAGPSEWKQLIDICVKKKQDYVIAQLRSLLEELRIPSEIKIEGPQMKEAVLKWVEEKREKMRDLKYSTYNEKKIGFWDIAHWLPDGNKFFDQKKLLEVAEKSQLRNTGWPVGVVLYKDESKPKPLQDGIEATIVSETFGGIDYWYFSTNGNYYFARTFEEDFRSNEKGGKVLYFDIQIWRVAEALLHCVELYKNLNLLPTEKISIQISWFGISERMLKASPHSQRHLFTRKCVTFDESWSKETTFGELSMKWEDFAIEAANKLFLMFDYFKIDEKIAKEIIEEFKKSRV